MRKLGVRSVKEYQAWPLKTRGSPVNPENVYASKGWTDWYDFSGRKPRLRPNPTPHAEAKEAVRRLGIRDKSGYPARQPKTARLPPAPTKTHTSKGWTGWYDFLGKERPPRGRDPTPPTRRRRRRCGSWASGA